MREALSVVPALYWVAFLFLALALWSDSTIGIFLGAACMVIGSLQLVRDQRQRSDGD